MRKIKPNNWQFTFAATMGLVAIYTTPSLAADIVASSTFDFDLDGWSSNNPAEISWASTGGNPGGYVLFNDLSESPTTISAPESFLGDWSVLNDSGFLKLDFRLFNAGLNPGDFLANVEISGPGGTARWSEINGDNSWETTTIEIKETTWEIVSGSWDSLLVNVTELKLPIETFTNSSGAMESSGIDNVQLFSLESKPRQDVSEPITFLGAAIAFGFGITLKKQSS